MDDIRSLKNKIKTIKQGLKRVANVRVHADVPRWAYIQALLSRGDRKVAQILSLAHKNRGNWPKTFKASPVNPDFYILRERSLDEVFPWDFIDHGINKSFLPWSPAPSAESAKKTTKINGSLPIVMGYCFFIFFLSRTVKSPAGNKQG